MLDILATDDIVFNHWAAGKYCMIAMIAVSLQLSTNVRVSYHGTQQAEQQLFFWLRDVQINGIKHKNVS